jgi:hypothetical protein
VADIATPRRHVANRFEIEAANPKSNCTELRRKSGTGSCILDACLAPGIVDVLAPPVETLAADRALALADFARACKGAARAVSLYPRTHPSIRRALERLTGAAARLLNGPALTLVVHPDRLLLDGRATARPDAAVGELATLLHERLVGELTIESEAGADDWHAFLLLLATSPDDLIAGGGFAKSWAATGRAYFAIREIDYAQVLRERGGTRDADWDHIIACCLDGGAAALDDRALAALLEAIADAEQFGALIDRLQGSGTGVPMSTGQRAAALLEMVRAAMDAMSLRGDDPDRALHAAAGAIPNFTPEMILALCHERTSESSAVSGVAEGILERATDESIAGFVATSIEAERGATDRLAQALEVLVPDAEHKSSIVDLARETARESETAPSAGFDNLWQGAKQMLLSYSDTNYVSSDYARELSAARQQAIEVERTSDDPPERLEAWFASVSDDAIRELDLLLLSDLLRIERDAAKWAKVVDTVVPEIERHTLLGNTAAARTLVDPIAAETGDTGRWDFAGEAGKALERLAAGPLVKHVVQHLRKVDDAEAVRLRQLCHAVGPGLARPLAEALAAEDNSRSIRRLRDLLLGFGSAGRHSVEQLKLSSNPAVRRTAIDLLRVLGGSEALPELVSMLGDSDPQVQRESIRAIVQIATPDAHAVLQSALDNGSSRETMIRELIDLRDDRTMPVLCYVLEKTPARGKLAQVHASVIDALGGLSPQPPSLQALKGVLYAGVWWAPLRTAALRKAAAAALRRLGSPEAIDILREAAANGSRGVRNAAQPEADAATRRERERA